MNGKKSKFEFDSFWNDYEYKTIFAVNRDKYTEEQAVEIYKKEIGEMPTVQPKKYGVRFGISFDSDGNKHNGWCLECSSTGKEPRYCPVWAFD